MPATYDNPDPDVESWSDTEPVNLGRVIGPDIQGIMIRQLGVLSTVFCSMLFFSMDTTTLTYLFAAAYGISLLVVIDNYLSTLNYQVPPVRKFVRDMIMFVIAGFIHWTWWGKYLWLALAVWMGYRHWILIMGEIPKLIKMDRRGWIAMGIMLMPMSFLILR